MKILFVSNIYPDSIETYRGVYIQNRAKSLIELGYDVKVCKLVEKERTNCAKPNDHFASFYSYAKTDKLSNIFCCGRKPVVSNSFFEFVNDFKPDLIIFFITQTQLEKAIIKRIGRNAYKYAKFFEGRNMFFEQKSPFNILVQKFIALNRKRHFAKFDYLMFCSKIAYDDFTFFCPKYKGIKLILTNGFDSNIFKFPRKHSFNNNLIKIISVGNIIETKGHHLLVNALNELSKVNKGVKIELLIIGDGSTNNLISHSQNLKIDCLNNVSQSDLKLIYNNYDYFILPSYYESFGCVYLEAMSQGLITVGCENQGPSIFIQDSINGFLLKENSLESLSNLILKIIHHEIDLERVSKNAISTSKLYTWHHFAQNFDKIFGKKEYN